MSPWATCAVNDVCHVPVPRRQHLQPAVYCDILAHHLVTTQATVLAVPPTPTHATHWESEMPTRQHKGQTNSICNSLVSSYLTASAFCTSAADTPPPRTDPVVTDPVVRHPPWAVHTSLGSFHQVVHSQHSDRHGSLHKALSLGHMFSWCKAATMATQESTNGVLGVSNGHRPLRCRGLHG